MKSTKTFIKIMAISACIAASGLSFSAHAQVDAGKHWYTIFTNATMPAKGAGCATVNMSYVTAPNMRANSLMAAPFGYTKAKVNTYTNITGSQGGWCPKSMTAFACEKREKLRAKYVWHNTLLTRDCGTVRWNGSVLYSK